jgi:hypothetical protein
MDIFHALDHTKHGVFKAQLMNNWAAGAGSSPMTVNEMFRLAKARVKTTTIKLSQAFQQYTIHLLKGRTTVKESKINPS